MNFENIHIASVVRTKYSSIRKSQTAKICYAKIQTSLKVKIINLLQLIGPSTTKNYG